MTAQTSHPPQLSQDVVTWWGRGDVRVERRALASALQPGWVRIEVAWCGLCGSDVAEFLYGPIAVSTVLPDGDPAAPVVPVVLGHEVSGTVIAAGDLDCSLLGAKVVTDTLVSCETCAACLAGQVNLCPELKVSGFTLDGGLAQFVDVPASSCVQVKDHVRLDVAALTEPLAVAVRAADRAEIGSGDRVVIVGLGAVGLMLATLLGPVGAVGVDPMPHRRSQARDLAGVEVHSSVQEMVAAGAGRDAAPERWVAFECAGRAQALDDTVAAAPANSQIVLVGAHSRAAPVDLHRFLHSELTMTATLSHSRSDMRRALDLLEDRPDRFAGLITHHVRLSDTPLVLESLGRADTPVVKALVGPAGLPWQDIASPD